MRRFLSNYFDLLALVINPTETLFNLKDVTALFISQHKLWNDAQLSRPIAMVTGFSWYTAAIF